MSNHSCVRSADLLPLPTSTTEDGGDDGLAHDALQISSRREQQFVLLRNWSLFEAMRHSRYVAARLNVWKQSGTDRLKNLLAKMGFSLDICKQNWCSMVRRGTACPVVWM